ncbi:MAG TPA: hypothetical protein VNM90_21000 [Haliangium sp.]|nr:hypothetical protein [Haliangium sp.]
MNLDKSGQLFFGCKIDSKLRDALSQAKPNERRYFEGTEFLTICAFDEEQWIGKILEGGLNVTEVDDIQRNVVSILRRIASDIRIPPSSIKIFVVEQEREAERSDASTTRDSRGPYIANY